MKRSGAACCRLHVSTYPCMGVYASADKSHRPLRVCRFAMLPEAVQARYTSPESFYQFGWSRGVEKVEGRPDFSKGSYYNNPQYDDPAPSSSDLTDKCKRGGCAEAA